MVRLSAFSPDHLILTRYILLCDRYIGEQVTLMLYGLSVLQAWLFFQRWKEQAFYLKFMVSIQRRHRESLRNPIIHLLLSFAGSHVHVCPSFFHTRLTLNDSSVFQGC